MSVEKITLENIDQLFEAVAALFAEKKDELCEMDARMGDGDLGLTMNKGYGALPQLIRENKDMDSIGKTLMKAGMKMAGLVPSTMGTLMASGIMAGGKALNKVTEIGPAELSAFIQAFSDGLQKRGKCRAGDRTIYDALLPAAKAAKEAENGTLADVVTAALSGAEAGVEATKDMVPKYGKAAVFAAKARGTADQGAVAGKYVLEGMKNYILQ